MKLQWSCLGLAAIFIIGSVEIVSADTYYVPSDTPDDTQAVKAAIAAASDGDTIVLEAGTFIFEKVTTTEDAIIQTSLGSYAFHADFVAPSGGIIGLLPGEWYEMIYVDKQLTLTGQLDADGNRLTRIYGPGVGPRTGGGILLLNAPNITVENLVFENLFNPVWFFNPGFCLRNCRFEEVRLACYLIPDVNWVYADPDAPVRSYMLDNEFYRCSAGPHINGCEMQIAGNVFSEIYQFNTLALVTWTEGAVAPGWPGDYSLSQGNVIEDNIFEDGKFGLYVVNVGGPGTIRNNLIRNNVFRNLAVGTYCVSRKPGAIHEENTVSDNLLVNCHGVAHLLVADANGCVRHNYYEGNEVHASGRFHAVEFLAINAKAEENIFTDNRFIDIYDSSMPLNSVFFARGVRNNLIIKNDYRESGFMGLRDTDWPPTILLLQDTAGNIVNEAGSFTPDTGGSKYHVVDEGTNNRVIGQSARNVEPPAGIGQYMREVMPMDWNHGIMP